MAREQAMGDGRCAELIALNALRHVLLAAAGSGRLMLR